MLIFGSSIKLPEFTWPYWRCAHAQATRSNSSINSPGGWFYVASLWHQARVLASLATQDVEIAEEVLIYRQNLNQIKREIHLRHLQQLSSGVAPNLDASAIHLEMVNAMSRVLSHTCSIARVVQGDL